ncbi:unnamed protein product [Amaranthus hypochondriacus]
MNETTEAKALAASRIHHKEAEKRRRERINSHLDRLRSILPCTSKTDKATLLSKVVQRVLELKRQTSELHQHDNLMIPSENDEAEISSLGGRIQSVFMVSSDNASSNDQCAVFLRDALKGIVNRSGSEERLKRRRRVFDAADC